MDMNGNQEIDNEQNAVECVVCGDRAEEIPPCAHGYCRECFIRLIRYACENGERWPPSCCDWRVNLDCPEIRDSLPPEVVRLFEDSKVYYSTKGKLFCCNNKCRKYIPPGEVDEYTRIGFCRGCWGGTCSLCRRHPHIGNCKKDFQQKSVEHYLTNMGWKRCEQCGSTVEKAAGCNHMVCNCGEQFCYVCGQHWRSCDCKQFGYIKPKKEEWFKIPQVPRCYGNEFLANICLPQTFFCAKCGHRCGKAGESSYQCQDCGRHLCKSCVIQCVDDGRYHNPDWNAEPAEGEEVFTMGRSTELSSNPEPEALSQPEKD